ncbi:MAG: esterase-like activity of phytase family protein [Candidatus Cryptobacteroides sp.]
MRKSLVIVLLSCVSLAFSCNQEKEPEEKVVEYPTMGEYSSVDVDILEISGVCLSPDNSFLYAVSDDVKEGKGGLYSLSFDGAEVNHVTKIDRDCEGLALNPLTKDIYLAIEREQAIVRLSAPDYQKAEDICVIKNEGFDTNKGLEGLCYYKDNLLFVGNQSPAELRIVSCETGETVGEPMVLPLTTEIAALWYDAEKDYLWVSDSNRGFLHIFSLEGEVLQSYNIKFVRNAEGICVDKQRGCIWVCTDGEDKLFKIEFQGL